MASSRIVLEFIATCYGNHQIQIATTYRAGTGRCASSASAEHAQQTGKGCYRQVPKTMGGTSSKRKPCELFVEPTSPRTRCGHEIGKERRRQETRNARGIPSK